MKKLMFAALAGAALMWFYDPANGAQRRQSLQRKINPDQSDAVAPMRIADATDRSPSATAAAR